MCEHKTCQEISKLRAGKRGDGGIGVAYIINYQEKGDYAILLGKERNGKYTNQYNLCAGKMNSSDNKCYINTAKRETKEEFKMCIDDCETFDSIFRSPVSNEIRLITFNEAPILVGVLKNVELDKIKQSMMNSIEDESLSYCYKEMSDLELFWLKNLEQIEGKDCQVSFFARAVMRKIDVTKL